MPVAMKVAVSACLFFFGIAVAQPGADKPKFEVASIKPSDPGGTSGIRRSGYRIAFSNSSLLFLITWAYDIQSDRLYSQPKWLDSVRYDIVGNAPAESLNVRPRLGQIGPFQRMMQALLAERFKLAVHRENRELAMYALVVAKGGPKVRLMEPPAAIGQNPFDMPGRGQMVGTQVSADMLARVLSNQLHRSVQDYTALKGVFDFKLEWEPEAAGLDEDPTVPGSKGRAAGASLFTAIQEQLGLKLEARKGPVEVLVIDHIERAPTEN